MPSFDWSFHGVRTDGFLTSRQDTMSLGKGKRIMQFFLSMSTCLYHYKHGSSNNRRDC